MDELANVGHVVVLGVLIFGHHDLLEETTAGLVDHTVDLQVSFTLGLDDDGVSLQVVDLGANVELHEAGTLVLGVLDGVQHGLVSHLCVSDGSQPVVDDSELFGSQRRPDSSTVVVAADDNVSDLEDLDGKLDDRERRKVRVGQQVGNVSMDKHLSGKQIQTALSGSRVGAADPQNLGGLALGVGGEQRRSHGRHSVGPLFVSLEQGGQRVGGSESEKRFLSHFTVGGVRAGVCVCVWWW